MKGKTFYSVKEYKFEGELLLKPNKKVKVIEQINNSYLINGDTEGMLSKEIFNSVFSPFMLNQIVFHSFYGIGQIVESNKPKLSAAVVFFCSPKQKYDLGDLGIPYIKISTL